MRRLLYSRPAPQNNGYGILGCLLVKEDNNIIILLKQPLWITDGHHCWISVRIVTMCPRTLAVERYGVGSAHVATSSRSGWRSLTCEPRTAVQIRPKDLVDGVNATRVINQEVRKRGSNIPVPFQGSIHVRIQQDDQSDKHQEPYSPCHRFFFDALEGRFLLEFHWIEQNFM